MAGHLCCRLVVRSADEDLDFRQARAPLSCCYCGDEIGVGLRDSCSLGLEIWIRIAFLVHNNSALDDATNFFEFMQMLRLLFLEPLLSS
jgi:hypothetical protein